MPIHSNRTLKAALAAGVAAAGLAIAVPAHSAGTNPCAAAKPVSCAQNPCNPCCAKNPCAAANPCNPCAAANPCNPCAAANPCNPCAAANPCNPCAAKN